MRRQLSLFSLKHSRTEFIGNKVGRTVNGHSSIEYNLVMLEPIFYQISYYFPQLLVLPSQKTLDPRQYF